MDPDVDFVAAQLREKISKTRSHLKSLTRQLIEAERQQNNRSRIPKSQIPQKRRNASSPLPPEDYAKESSLENGSSRWPLAANEYRRYGRQMILPQIGLQGQLRLKEASVLIVGLGGLGCPAAAYLAGAGVGKIGLVDGDGVETSNLHRQIIHTTSRVTYLKVASAQEFLEELNPLSTYPAYLFPLIPQEAVEIFKGYDLILDCTDHPTSRYLISDAAVLAGKPLVSASALGMEGQLLVLNDPYVVNGKQPGKFCYRCVFPKPSPPETVSSCGEGGIFGPVVGVLGVLMATAALKLLVRGNDNSITQSSTDTFGVPGPPTMLLYSAISDPMFRTVKIKGKRDDCPSCSRNAVISEGSLSSGSLDYVAFCGTKTNNPLKRTMRTRPIDYLQQRRRLPPNRCILIDVRPRTEYDIAKIDGSINVPIEDLKRPSSLLDLNKELERILPSPGIKAYQLDKLSTIALNTEHKIFNEISIHTICRHGNDSQTAAKILSDYYKCSIGDIKGGIDAWRRDVDPTFPDY